MSDTKDIEMKAPEANDIEDLVTDIQSSFSLLQKVATTFDNRYITKLFRGLGSLSRKLKQDETSLSTVLTNVYGSIESKSYIFEYIDASTIPESESKKSEVLPEIDLYLHLLVQLYLLDSDQIDKLSSFNRHVVSLMKVYNRRSLDFIYAKIWFYISRATELANDLYWIRPELLYAFRTATLRHDTETVASIVTILLRNYLLTKDIDQALNLIEKSEFPENANTSLGARYYYYVARIHAIQLNYSLANECCITAIRKAPQTKFSVGFIQSATKLSIIIELLMGDIPELKVFKTNEFEPYFMVTRAVKVGDLKLFDQVLKKYKADFVKDDNYTLISRLHQNVIKTGIRIISLSYSKISLKDICIKLHLDSEESTEYIVAKAIRDGVIEATINNEKGFMQSKELLDIYSTKLPQDEFDQRIKFCLSLHNDSVKSMRYPSENLKDDTKNSETFEDEFELLKAIEEGDLDDFMD
ncbi:26S proteasome non-ATPase regulatory subunit [Yamadazyma tenuis]|uniref:PCI-domain-containing protein n=1 Tax=Candida tenuis (strain ATCC 10573 / BCRC 21748 / CBS 615 / JCM 9827 / NBRC 10315 / NRRL Y-1498 / VKM Y-70) TaxID=590646 RepID=G3AZD5_CANTC|nr:PCI-domain-containing protein [Yamadazyma tenuis ATCC 10573]EGV66068.1 PCI-domain-containing protein [Yamadazyma tenuis ATCC 10573]WEJ95584.1 26S proteasome non-ATPase regulatory subunit [Yamadazyma tenuis]